MLTAYKQLHESNFLPIICHGTSIHKYRAPFFRELIIFFLESVLSSSLYSRLLISNTYLPRSVPILCKVQLGTFSLHSKFGLECLEFSCNEAKTQYFPEFLQKLDMDRKISLHSVFFFGGGAGDVYREHNRGRRP